MVRAGSSGQNERIALDAGLVMIDYGVPDLSDITTKKSLKTQYLRVFPDAPKANARNVVGQIWRFRHDMQKGDLVALPLKSQKAIAIGEIIGDYEFKESNTNPPHVRRVQWIKIIPRAHFDQDLLHSLGAFMTVCKISRNDAENRIRSLLAKADDP